MQLYQSIYMLLAHDFYLIVGLCIDPKVKPCLVEWWKRIQAILYIYRGKIVSYHLRKYFSSYTVLNKYFFHILIYSTETAQYYIRHIFLYEAGGGGG
jgi:hypothetical protein